jgi:hypothetical protein
MQIPCLNIHHLQVNQVCYVMTVMMVMTATVMDYGRRCHMHTLLQMSARSSSGDNTNEPLPLPMPKQTTRTAEPSSLLCKWLLLVLLLRSHAVSTTVLHSFAGLPALQHLCCWLENLHPQWVALRGLACATRN